MGVNRIKVNYFEEDPHVSIIPTSELECDNIESLSVAISKQRDVMSIELDIHLTCKQDCHALSLLVNKLIGSFD